jgi:hypothetical protein
MFFNAPPSVAEARHSQQCRTESLNRFSNSSDRVLIGRFSNFAFGFQTEVRINRSDDITRCWFR